MKNILLLAVCFFALVSVNAQRRDGGENPQGRQGGQGNQTREMPEFNASNVAGILKYDNVLVAKKLKVKEDSVKKSIHQALSKYNNEIDEIAVLYKDSLDAVNLLMNTAAKDAMRNGNREMMQNLRRVVQQKIKPVRERVKKNEMTLNESMKVVLVEKQYEKWMKFQRAEKRALNPRQNQDGGAGDTRPNGGGSQGGRNQGGGERR
jgi:hypothetical protein